MTAPQRVDPARIRNHVRARTVADVAHGLVWVCLIAAAAGLLGGAPIAFWVGLLAGIPSVVVTIVATHLADRYRQPADNTEDER